MARFVRAFLRTSGRGSGVPCPERRRCEGGSSSYALHATASKTSSLLELLGGFQRFEILVYVSISHFFESLFIATPFSVAVFVAIIETSNERLSNFVILKFRCKHCDGSFAFGIREIWGKDVATLFILRYLDAPWNCIVIGMPDPITSLAHGVRLRRVSGHVQKTVMLW